MGVMSGLYGDKILLFGKLIKYKKYGSIIAYAVVKYYLGISSFS